MRGIEKLEPGFWTPPTGPVWVPDGSANLGEPIPAVSFPSDRVRLPAVGTIYGPDLIPPVPPEDQTPDADTTAEEARSIIDQLLDMGRKFRGTFAPVLNDPTVKIILAVLPFGLLLLLLLYLLKKRR